MLVRIILVASLLGAPATAATVNGIFYGSAKIDLPFGPTSIFGFSSQNDHVGPPTPSGAIVEDGQSFVLNFGSYEGGDDYGARTITNDFGVPRRSFNLVFDSQFSSDRSDVQLPDGTDRKYQSFQYAGDTYSVDRAQVFYRTDALPGGTISAVVPVEGRRVDDIVDPTEPTSPAVAAVFINPEETAASTFVSRDCPGLLGQSTCIVDSGGQAFQVDLPNIEDLRAEVREIFSDRSGVDVGELGREKN